MKEQINLYFVKNNRDFLNLLANLFKTHLLCFSLKFMNKKDDKDANCFTVKFSKLQRIFWKFDDIFEVL